jgi:hypothetical protein
MLEQMELHRAIERIGDFDPFNGQISQMDFWGAAV